jgi:hypothetical protein
MTDLDPQREMLLYMQHAPVKEVAGNAGCPDGQHLQFLAERLPV